MDAPLIWRTANSCPVARDVHCRGFVVVQLKQAERRGVGHEQAALTRLPMSFQLISSHLLARIIACPTTPFRGVWKTAAMTAYTERSSTSRILE